MGSYSEFYTGPKHDRYHSGPQAPVSGNFRLMPDADYNTHGVDNYPNREPMSARTEPPATDFNKNKLDVHRPRLNRKPASPGTTKTSSGITTKFDPMKDRHMWAMWRTAVNGRIVDQVKRNEQSRYDGTISEDFGIASGSDARTSTYGKDLASVPPLARFIRLNESSQGIANGLMNEGHGQLQTTQFIYYGLPRVTINTPYFNNTNNNNNHNYNNHLGKDNSSQDGSYNSDASNYVHNYNGNGNGNSHAHTNGHATRNLPPPDYNPYNHHHHTGR